MPVSVAARLTSFSGSYNPQAPGSENALGADQTFAFDQLLSIALPQSSPFDDSSEQGNDTTGMASATGSDQQVQQNPAGQNQSATTTIAPDQISSASTSQYNPQMSAGLQPTQSAQQARNPISMSSTILANLQVYASSPDQSQAAPEDPPAPSSTDLSETSPSASNAPINQGGAVSNGNVNGEFTQALAISGSLNSATAQVCQEQSQTTAEDSQTPSSTDLNATSSSPSDVAGSPSTANQTGLSANSTVNGQFAQATAVNGSLNSTTAQPSQSQTALPAAQLQNWNQSNEKSKPVKSQAANTCAVIDPSLLAVSVQLPATVSQYAGAQSQQKLDATLQPSTAGQIAPYTNNQNSSPQAQPSFQFHAGAAGTEALQSDTNPASNSNLAALNGNSQAAASQAASSASPPIATGTSQADSNSVPQSADSTAPNPAQALLQNSNGQNPLASLQQSLIGSALNQVSSNTTQTTQNATTGQLQLSAPNDSPAMNFNAMAVEIAAQSQDGIKQFHIQLDPPELGRVDVRLSIDQSGKAQAHLSADQPNTLDLLQKDAPTLTRALRDAGLNFSQSGLNFSLRGQEKKNSGGGGTQQSRRNSSNSLQANTSIGAMQSSTAYQASLDGRLDIRV